jgi:F0F1-type ATP synthase assembly protein I
MDPYIVETLMEQHLRHVFYVSLVISTMAVVAIGVMYFRKSKRLPSRRTAIAIQLITGIIPTSTLIVDLILAALDGINITTIMNSMNAFEGMIWVYIAFLIIHFGVGIRAIRKLPEKLPLEKLKTRISQSLTP